MMARPVVAATQFLVCGLLVVIGAVAPCVAPAANSRLAGRVTADSLHLTRVLRGDRTDSLVFLLDRDIAVARRWGEPGVLARLLRLRGIAHAVSSRDAAVQDLDECLRLGEGLRDTGLVKVALRWRAYMAGLQRRFEEQNRLSHRLLTLAERTGDTRMEAVAHSFIGWNAGEQGRHREALSHLEIAASRHRGSGDRAEEAVALAALGASQSRTGDYDGANATYSRLLELARGLKSRRLEAQARSGLGTIESLVGNPHEALEHHQAAWRIQQSIGETLEAAQAQAALVRAYHQAGRLDEASALSNDGLDLCIRRGFHATKARFLAERGWIESELGRHEAAADDWRMVIGMGDSAEVESRTSAVQGIARSLGSTDRHEEMLELLRAQSPVLLPRCSARGRVELEASMIHALVLARRWPEAIELAERAGAEAESLDARGIAVWIWRNAGSSFAALGREARAQVAFERGVRNWEAWRRDAPDADWQERRTRQIVPLAEGYMNFLRTHPGLSDSSRVARAHDLLQRFKSRTLLERFSRASVPAPAAPNAGPITSARLRAELLRPGELLLEWFAGEGTTYLFAISRGEQRMLCFSDRSLRKRVEVAKGLLGERPRSREDEVAAVESAGALGTTLLGGVSDMIARSRTVILAPDDFLYEVAFAALEVPGVPGPLGVARTLVHVPSAGVLAEVRGFGARGGAGILAIAPIQASEDSDRIASTEVEWLARGYEAVTVVHPSPTRRFVPADLEGYSVLHFTGHTQIDERFPWRSAFALGRRGREGETPADSNPAALRAEAIARTRLEARLVVLASCRTLGARVLRAEGVAGFANAFLVAGVPTVVATLWPVEDGTTGRLMQEYYRGLGRGARAADALRAAQDVIRRDRRTRHPWYWAGFVIVGEPDTEVHLAPKPLSPEGLLRRLVPWHRPATRSRDLSPSGRSQSHEATSFR